MATLEEDSIKTEKSVSEEIERGSFAPAINTIAEQTKLVIATYNIRYAVGSFLITGSLFRRAGLSLPSRRKRLVASHISRAARALSDGIRMPRVDVLALQEADKQTVRAGGVHITRELAREMQMDYAHASFNAPRGVEMESKQWYLDFEERIAPDDAGDTGLAMLSRLPLNSITRMQLPGTDCAWRPRLALETVIQIGEKKLFLYNTHIDPHGSIAERLKQQEAILERAAENANAPVILLGDFNTLTREARKCMRSLLESHGYTTPFADGTATWRAGLIRLHTDWVFVRGVRITSYGVARGLSVSDHWPVWIEIDL
ncbi:MAG: endonuclease/exonuclease/phosphatase family protein [Pyrinomonadaceae bacterium]|nr:endonuclease/exonuclease/phosphatase family protein [Pyrinomonadaceae bacterium]